MTRQVKQVCKHCGSSFILEDEDGEPQYLMCCRLLNPPPVIQQEYRKYRAGYKAIKTGGRK